MYVKGGRSSIKHNSGKIKPIMFNFTTVVFDGTSPTFYFTNTSGWNTSSSNAHVWLNTCILLQCDMISPHKMYMENILILYI